MSVKVEVWTDKSMKPKLPSKCIWRGMQSSVPSVGEHITVGDDLYGPKIVRIHRDLDRDVIRAIIPADTEGTYKGDDSYSRPSPMEGI